MLRHSLRRAPVSGAASSSLCGAWTPAAAAAPATQAQAAAHLRRSMHSASVACHAASSVGFTAASAAAHSARGLHSSAAALARHTGAGRGGSGGQSMHGASGNAGKHFRGARSIPPRTAKHDREWDKVRSARNPLITTVDPATKPPALAPNDYEIDQLSFRYGLPPLPTLAERVQTYRVERAYYDRRDQRIRDHLGRLLRMKPLSKAEMLILIAQVEEAHWNLPDMQRAYVPELHHAERDELEEHHMSLRLGTGGAANIAAFRAKKQAKREKRAAGEPVKPPKEGNDGAPKYGYRRDLANFGPEAWDYLSPYVILEPESRHDSYLDGAFRDEDRYVQWDVEARNLALGAKLQRMKQLGIPLELANSMVTPQVMAKDHVFPNSSIRRAVKRLYARGGRPTDAWWRNLNRRPSNLAANERLLKRKEAKTMTEARRNIPAYIKRFEQEQTAVEVNVGATTVLAQNLYLQQRIEQEKKKPSLLTKAQQQSAKNLMAVFAQRNRLAMKKMFLSTKNMWERLMIERAIEKKYLEQYMTIGSDYTNSKYLLQMEAEMMAVVKEVADRFQDIDWKASSLQLRDFKHAQEQSKVDYSKRYIEKMEEAMDKYQELPGQENFGERNWMDDMLEWEGDPLEHDEGKELEKTKEREHVELDAELDTWNEWFDVQVAQELGAMIDCGEVANEDDIHDGAIMLAEKRVAKRLHASRPEWKEWKYRPQYMDPANMGGVPDVTAVSEQEGGLGGAEKSAGQQIIEQILAKDPMIAASKRWKARMAPRFADVDRYENEQAAGNIVQHLDEHGNYLPPTVATTGSGVPLVDSIHGEGSVLPDYDPSLSTAGHQVMNMNDVAQRRAMVAHATGTPQQVDEYLRHEVEDPMLELLNEHTRGASARRKAMAGSGEDDAGGNRNSFSTINPKLGFEDDDFRLYDPVLTKVSKNSSGKPGEAEESDPNGSLADAVNERAEQLKQDGENYLEDEDTDPAMWQKWADRTYRRTHFLDLDPFGPANTDERRDFDDEYFHLDEEDYAYRNRIDPETAHQKPLTQMTYVEPYDETPTVMRFDLDEQTQSVMYMLHRSDPARYTPRALAHKFQLSAARVKSTLIMMAIHYRMVANGVVHPLMHSYTEERAYEDLLHPSLPMIHDPPKFAIQRLPDYRWVREDDMHRVLAEEKAIEDRFLSRSARLDKREEQYYAKYGAIGTDPPEIEPALPLDDRIMSPSRRSIMLVDISEIPASRFAMAVREKRGGLREPTEEEYNFIRNQEKGIHKFTYVKYHREDIPM